MSLRWGRFGDLLKGDLQHLFECMWIIFHNSACRFFTRGGIVGSYMY
jgi:hypothetical protein